MLEVPEHATWCSRWVRVRELLSVVATPMAAKPARTRRPPGRRGGHRLAVISGLGAISPPEPGGEAVDILENLWCAPHLVALLAGELTNDLGVRKGSKNSLGVVRGAAGCFCDQRRVHDGNHSANK